MLKSTLTTLGILFAFSAAAQQLNHVQGEILVQFHPKVENVQSILRSYQTYRGRNAAIKVEICLSETMNIWQVKFNFSTIHERQFLQTLRADRAVQNAQFNHFITFRKTPNDPDFIKQWQYINDGALGGNPEADLDADLAWDITTGGVTINGDTIVVAALDDGLDLDHIDIVENVWVNHNEIPENGIDDDNNGYIDDINGWNAGDNSGNVGQGGSHGTPVMGIIGATGNNGIGVTGISWDVKVMMVKTDFIADEATLIAGYGYPLALRKKYNETNGAEGAFVVATNASWGVDNGMPEDSPIWCALYDSLGTNGILNVGATVNENTNVDVEGDLPTTCPSDYLIGVTNVNRVGEKEFFAGFGKKNIDLGAFGEDTYTIARNNRYDAFGGTSGAAPHVTGAIGLLYAAPCYNFGAIMKNNPAEAALLVREYILEGVKPNEFLDTLTATGGQLNLNNSLNLLMDACGPCPPPVAVSISEIIDVSATISWIASEEETASTLRYRTNGTVSWTTLNNVQAPYNLINLSACTNYEFQLKSDCGNETSGFGRTYEFKTDGCCIPPENVQIGNVSVNSVIIEWDPLLAAQSYEVRFNILGAGNIQQFSTTKNYIEFNDLLVCTNYEFQVRTICSNMTTEFTEIQVVTTNGCGSCTDLDYCISKAEFEDEWISKVTLNTLENETGSDLGYGDYTGISTDLNTLENYEIKVNFDYQNFPFLENVQVWIDYNQDGAFDTETENVINLEEDVESEFIGDFTIPVDAKIGLTRMRVAIKWREGNDPTKPGPCDKFDFGEVEDYCVNIIQSEASCFIPKGFELLDDPIDDITFLSWQSAIGALEYNYRYRIEGTEEWETNATDNPTNVFLSKLSRCHTYEFQAQSVCDSMKTSDFSESFLFNTQCDCNPPAEISQIDTANNSIKVEWSTTEMADKYEVTINKVGENSLRRTVVTTNQAEFSSLDKCTDYDVRVRAYCLDTNGNMSLVFSARTACEVALTEVPIDVEKISVFPNPFSQFLKVEIDLKERTDLSFKLYDVSGKLLIVKVLSELPVGLQTLEISTNDLVSGVYLLGVETEKGRTVRRVIRL